ncbi:MAG: acetylxylan esterase [Planctomycetia bacterium]|nr:acetylxylan esterase [Planctomycetia bacterium]
MKKITSFILLTCLMLTVVVTTLFCAGLVLAQDKSYQNFLNNKEQYGVPLGDLLREAEKDLQIKIVWDKKVEPYLEEKVIMAPWKFWNDPVRRLSYFLAPFDLSFEQVDDTTWRVFEPWYYVRPEAEAKAHLDRLARQYSTKELWETRKVTLKSTILEKMRLTNVPRDVQNANVSEKRVYDGYSVRNVALEILPGYFVNGNLYEPLAEGKFPVVLCPHGHGVLGRFGETQQIRSSVLARMGAVVFAYNMFAWRLEDQPLPKEAHADPISGTIQTLQTMRAIDWLTTLPNVDGSRIGITGASGGGTQTFLGTALDPRITVSVPVVMVSAHFYGGCPCESGIPFHILHGGTCNAEVAAMAAPRPMKIIAVTQDWTKNVPEVEFPYIQKIYDFYGAKEKVEFSYFDEKHGYSEAMRKAMYPFMAKHLQLDLNLADETKVTVEPIEKMTYWGPERENYPKNAIQTLDELKEVFQKSIQ